jgi:Glycosyltransferases involved in cell wall biogenesis
VEKYLQRCVDSVLAQDFTNWEMILVDDGSPDRCPQMCDAFAEKDVRIKVVHKKNGGLVSARKAGFEQAKGEYLMFLDSDDSLLPKALTILYDAILSKGADVVKGTHILRYPAKDVVDCPLKHNYIINTPDEYVQCLLNYEIHPYLWGGIYRKKLFNSDVFKELLDFSVGEDILTNMSIALNIKTYCTIDDTVYVNGVNAASMMHSNVLSYEYLKRESSKICSIVAGYNEETCNTAIRHSIISYIKALFAPELKWNDTIYNEVRLYEQYHRNELYQHIDNKFLRFINNKLLYKTYTKIYKILFLNLRLHGKKRKIIY